MQGEIKSPAGRSSSHRELKIQSDGLSLELAKHSPHEFFYITLAGSLLAGAAGFVNGCTLLGVTEISAGHHKSFTTSHMTGTTTVSGLSLGENQFEDFAVCLCLIISFCFGAFLAGCFTRKDSKPWEIGPEYGPLFLFLSAILFAACAAAYADPNTFTYYYLAAMAMGFQNSLTSKYSGSLIRTTHVTGTVTDIGLILGQYTRGVTKDLWKLPVLTSLLVFFSIGGVLSVQADTNHNKGGLVVVAVFYFAVAIFVQVFLSYSRKQRFIDVLFGYWEHVAPEDNDDDNAHRLDHRLEESRSPLHVQVPELVAPEDNDDAHRIEESRSPLHDQFPGGT